MHKFPTRHKDQQQTNKTKKYKTRLKILNTNCNPAYRTPSLVTQNINCFNEFDPGLFQLEVGILVGLPTNPTDIGWVGLSSKH